MSDPPTREQWRAVPMEKLRSYALRATERSSVREVAEQIGIGRTSLRYFLTRETTPHPKNRRLLAIWYLQQIGNNEVDTRVCDALLGEIPHHLRDAAVGELAAFVRELHGLHGSTGPAN